MKTTLLKKEAITLKDFLFNSSSNAIVKMEDRYNAGEFLEYLLIKITDNNNSTVVLGKPVNPNVIKHGYSIDYIVEFRYLLTLNEESNYLIYENWVDVPKELSGISGYKIIDADGLRRTMKEVYENEFYKLLDTELPEIRKSNEYIRAYEIRMEDVDRIKKEAKNYFEHGYHPAKCSIRLMSYQEKPYEYNSLLHGEFIDFEENIFDVFHLYLTEVDFIETIVKHNFLIDYSIDNIAYVDIYNGALNELVNQKGE